MFFKKIAALFKNYPKYIPVYLIKSGILFVFLYFQFIDYIGELSFLYIRLLFVLRIAGLIIDIVITVIILFILAAAPPRPPREENVFYSLFPDNLKELFPHAVIIAAVTALMFGIYFVSIPIGEKIEAVKIYSDISNADAVFEYNESEYFFSGIKDIDTIHDLIIINYSKHTAAFLFRGSLEKYAKLRLWETNEPPEGIVQCDFALPSPGARLVTYRPTEERWGTTCAIALYTEDGRVYALENITEREELNNGFFDLNPNDTPRQIDKDSVSVIWVH